MRVLGRPLPSDGGMLRKDGPPVKPILGRTWISGPLLIDNVPMWDSFPMDLVAPGLFVGRAPTSLNHFQAIRDRGVKALLSLQTEAEAAQHGLLPDVAVRAASSLGMTLDRVPIPDLDPMALKRLVGAAVMRLDDLLQRHHQVYLHCAAGLNRSPTVAAAWIAWRQSLDALSACALVRQAHSSAPDVEAVRDFLARIRSS